MTVYAPTVFRQAGFSSQKSALLSGINDLTYAAAVWVAVLTIDTWGRRMILYVGAIVSPHPAPLPAARRREPDFSASADHGILAYHLWYRRSLRG